jgi:hypothetical protein
MHCSLLFAGERRDGDPITVEYEEDHFSLILDPFAIIGIAE